MPERYPGYNVLRKRNSQSWNEATRRVIDERLALGVAPRFFSADEWLTLCAIEGRIVPRNFEKLPIPAALLVDHKLYLNDTDGFRNARLPPLRQAWRLGLLAIEAAALEYHETRFHQLDGDRQDQLLRQAQTGELNNPAWGTMPSGLFFKDRLLRDMVMAYYAFPAAWSEIGFGGPASPRGYVRMSINRRDPWEAVEVHGNNAAQVRRENERVR